MSSKTKSLLLPFYFGSLKEGERIQIEREMLTDSEILLDYLDLKRTLEQADSFPSAPSVAVWARLRKRFVTRRKLFLSLSFGAAAAAIVIFFIGLSSHHSEDAAIVAPVQDEVLFDSMGEPSSHLNVL